MTNRRCDLLHDLVLPVLLFMAFGGMTWAVRGSSGYGASAGCIFAGVMWGAGWWFLAHERTGPQTRRYHSAWIVLAVTLGVGYSGSRGWMQWTHFFDGHISTNYAKQEWVDIDRSYGFLWLFIAGVPWAGIGACMLAWCGSLRETRACHWLLRIAMGVGGAYLAQYLFTAYPQFFLPLHSTIKEKYDDLTANPSLRRLINDNRQAVFHMGYYLGFLLFEVLRRDWKNVVLITTVGLVNGVGWAALQHWKWAATFWPSSNFNYWRCWESSGGLSIGLAYGIAYFLVNRPMDQERAAIEAQRPLEGPNFEWLLVFCGLASYSAMFLAGQTVGWSHYGLLCLQVFALIYYLKYRSQPASTEVDGTTPSGLTGNPEWAAYLIVLAHCVPLILMILLGGGGRGGGGGGGEGGGTVPLIGPLLASIFRPFVDSYLRPYFGQGFFFNYNLLIVAGITGVGLAWHWMNKAAFDAERRVVSSRQGDPNLERMGLYLGLLFGLLHSARSGLKGYFNIYRKDFSENEWSRWLWEWMGPLMVAGVVVIVLVTLWRHVPLNFSGVRFPHAYGAIWLVMIVQNVLGQMVTGPLSNWGEVQFSLYYLQLFLLTAVIVAHENFRKRNDPLTADREQLNSRADG